MHQLCLKNTPIRLTPRVEAEILLQSDSKDQDLLLLQLQEGTSVRDQIISPIELDQVNFLHGVPHVSLQPLVSTQLGSMEHIGTYHMRQSQC